MIKFFIWSLLLLGADSLCAKILKFDLYEKSRTNFPVTDVCQKLVKHASPLIEVAGINRLDCMGEIVTVGRFCEEQMKNDPFYARAFVDKEKKSVICQSAGKVVIQYQCEGKADRFCKQSKKGCIYMKERFATSLITVHDSLIVSEEGQKVLSCYFEAKNYTDLSILK